jgi:Carboxypeptidase regulatory-like domain
VRSKCGTAAALTLLVALTAHAQEAVKVTGRVVDTAGKPVAGVEVATTWNAENDRMTPYKGATTDAEGRFTLSTYPHLEALLALDKGRKTGGLVLLEAKAAGKPVEIKLLPLVYVHGQFFCKELNKRPPWTNVYMTAGPARFLYCISKEAKFSFRLPPGAYKFWGYGTDIKDLKKDLTLTADKPDVDLGTLEMAPTVIAKHVGKAPPALHVTDARGLKKGVQLSDLKGKWVLIEFWGFW